MQVKVTPLNYNPNTDRDEPTSNLSYAQLAAGRLRMRLDFLPINEMQHVKLLELLDTVEARIIRRAGTEASPIYLELEIGPAQSADAAEQASSEADSALGAGTEAPAAPQLPATPSGGPKALPATKTTQLPKASKSAKKKAKKGNAPAAADQASAIADDTAGDEVVEMVEDLTKDEPVN